MNKYERHSVADTASVLNFLLVAKHHKLKKIMVNEQRVNADSVRLDTFFYKGLVCAHCRLTASFFALERDLNHPAVYPFHLNLYGIKEGKEILFTQDHSQPRSKGGKDTMDNSQTMCYPCNQAKADKF